jgi:ABC-2 type transport system permease protein
VILGRPGSTLWLLGCEMRLAWRNLWGARRLRVRIISMAVVGLVALSLGSMLALALRGAEIPINRFSILAADVASLLVFTLMLSQTLAAATEALYTRGDLDLLFSAPIAPRKVLTARFASLAATAFSAFALLAAPLIGPAAIFGHWKWLAFFAVLAALAMAASGAGLALAVGLFRLIGARRTRTVAQLMAAAIGAAFFLVSQARTVLGGRGATGIWMQVASAANDPKLTLPPGADWPLRAALGEPAALAGVLVAGLAIFLGASAWLARRFAADSSAAQGADTAAPRRRTRPPGAFTGGAFAATFVKELRLLWRDIALISQVLLRALYLIPVTFLAIHSAGSHATLVLPGASAAIAFLAGQVGGSLTWITVSAEDAPELIAASPARFQTVRNAKLAAGLAPLAGLLVVPLGVFAFLAPIAGLAALLGAAASATAAGLINAWHPKPGKRSEFRRRRQGSVLIGFAGFFETALIGAATALAALASPLALGPAALALLLLGVLRRSPERIAETLAAA